MSLPVVMVVELKPWRRHYILGFEYPEPHVARRVSRVAVDLVVQLVVVRRGQYESCGVVPDPADGEGAVVKATEIEGLAPAVRVLHDADDERVGCRDELHVHGLPDAPCGPEQHEAANLAASCGAGAPVQI